jgi:hypothetical protein
VSCALWSNSISVGLSTFTFFELDKIVETKVEV